jgi:peptidylprolyl isomerase
MKQKLLLPILLVTVAAADPAPAPKSAPSPGEIVATAPAGDWVDIAPDDMLVMTLAPDAKGKARVAIIQLMAPPFSQGWVANIRTLAKAHWYDGVAVVRVQDNYVTQWGDPNGDDDARKKALPAGLKATAEGDYLTPLAVTKRDASIRPLPRRMTRADAYAGYAFFLDGWPMAADNISYTPAVYARTGKLDPQPTEEATWPIHCYGAVGVARGMSPDAGSGAELYTVIGHAPRQLDRNIAVVGRVIEGMEHLSSLPRGSGPLGFYEKEGERAPILSVRLASDLPAAQRPHFQYLSTQSDSFVRYADARANRRDPFFIVPANGADICNIPVPIRRAP